MPEDKGKEKTRALDLAISQIEKEFGKGSIMRLGGDHYFPLIECIPSGSIALDAALGIGGFPRGRVIEIYGPESGGKTTLTLHVIAQAQKAGGIAAFIDAEHALDAKYAGKLGVDIHNLLVSQPDSGEQALEITEVLVRSGAIDVVVVDSVAALVPRAELEGEMGDAQMGLQARLMSQALRKLTGVVSKSKTSLIFINQIREKIGVVFGNPETTTGGRAPPFREVEFDIMYGEGISREGELLDLAVKQDIVDKSGSWFSFDGERLGQGRENAKQFLRENMEYYARIEEKVREALGLGIARAAAAVAAPSNGKDASSLSP